MATPRTPANPPMHRDQQALLARANQSATTVSGLVLDVWHRLVNTILQAGGDDSHLWPVAYRAAQNAMRTLAPELVGGIYHDLVGVARHAHERTVEVAIDHIPVAHLVAAAVQKGAIREQRLIEADPAEPLPNEADDWADVAASALFPPPTLNEINQVVLSGDWPKRIESLTRLATPDAVAGIVAAGFQHGLTPTAIARQLRPLVANVQASAARVVRTESMRVAHETQFQMYEQVPGVVGYQIHSMHFPATREWHARRDGTIYYRDPKPGQKGFRQMPRPPMEADDPGERPSGTPHVAANCLCWLTPVMGVAMTTGTPADRLRLMRGEIDLTAE